MSHAAELNDKLSDMHRRAQRAEADVERLSATLKGALDGTESIMAYAKERGCHAETVPTLVRELCNKLELGAHELTRKDAELASLRGKLALLVKDIRELEVLTRSNGTMADRPVNERLCDALRRAGGGE